jgi:hypothetical protein
MAWAKPLSWAKANELIAAAAADAKKDLRCRSRHRRRCHDLSRRYLRLLGEVKTAFPQAKLFSYEAVRR